LEGLQNRLSQSNVSVIRIKPGFVDTPMTSGCKKSPFFATPKTIAKGIVGAITKKKDVVYLPVYWRWIMVVIKISPGQFF